MTVPPSSPMRRLWNRVGALPPPKKPAAPAESGADAAPGEVEDAASLQKELPFLGKEEAEARQVHLLLVDLDLREVGVVGEVGRQVLRDAHFHVEPEIAVTRAGHERVGLRKVTDGVRLDLDVPACRGRFEPDQGAGRRNTEDAGRAVATSRRDREPGQIDPLVLASNRPS